MMGKNLSWLCAWHLSLPTTAAKRVYTLHEELDRKHLALQSTVCCCSIFSLILRHLQHLSSVHYGHITVSPSNQHSSLCSDIFLVLRDRGVYMYVVYI